MSLKPGAGSIIGSMVIDMNDSRLITLAQLRAFLAATLPVQFRCGNDDQRYRLIDTLLQRFGYATLAPRQGAGAALPGRTTGYSRQQLSRLVARPSTQARWPSPIGPRRGLRPPLQLRRRGAAGPTDALHATLSGPATATSCAAPIPVRRHPLRAPGRPQCRICTTSRVPATWRAAGVDQDPLGKHSHRRAPRSGPRWTSGFIRIDSVHQGDYDGLKASITSMPWTASPSSIWCHLRAHQRGLPAPVLSTARDFPFTILGFHADNGSDTSTTPCQAAQQAAHRVHQVAPSPHQRQCPGRDQERRHRAQAPGYAHIPQRFATSVNAFCPEFLNPYLNFHRPSLFPEHITDNKGRMRKRYPQHMMIALRETLFLPSHLFLPLSLFLHSPLSPPLLSPPCSFLSTIPPSSSPPPSLLPSLPPPPSPPRVLCRQPLTNGRNGDAIASGGPQHRLRWAALVVPGTDRPAASPGRSPFLCTYHAMR